MGYDTQRMFWQFIAERQAMFDRRRLGQAPPWTKDTTLANYRFTNVYRVADRVSQYLVGHVQQGEGTRADKPEVVFRTLLFRLFNTEEAYEALTAGLGTHPNLDNWQVGPYYTILRQHELRGGRIWNNAYMITPPPETYGKGPGSKMLGWLQRLDAVVAQDWPRIIVQHVYDNERVFKLLHSLDTVGEFFAMQWTTDLGYALPWMDEHYFLVPGEGSKRGLKKLGLAQSTMAIRELHARQDDCLPDSFIRLGGSHPLSIMDIQNCCCEFDKWMRVVAPGLSGTNYRRPKQSYDTRKAHPLAPFHFPPHWNLKEVW